MIILICHQNNAQYVACEKLIINLIKYLDEVPDDPGHLISLNFNDGTTVNFRHILKRRIFKCGLFS